jgi:uncharacterized repeat protein (TIGR01451 family)
MTSPNHKTNSKRILACLYAALVWLLQSPVGAQILNITQVADRDKASIRNYQVVTFRLSYNCASTTQDANMAFITNVLDSNFEFVGATKSPHVESVTYVAIFNTVMIKFFNPLPAGSTGDVSIQVRFKQATPAGYKAKNQADIFGLNSLLKQSKIVEIEAVDPPIPVVKTGLKFESKVYVKKNVPSNVNQNRGWATYTIAHGHSFPEAQPVENYSITDVFPNNLALEYFRADYFPQTNVPVNVFYQTNLSSVWRAWPGNPRVNTVSSRPYIYPAEIGLPTGEYVRGLKFDYGTLPGGGLFHQLAQTAPIEITTRVHTPEATPVGAKLKNCADLDSSKGMVQSCGSRETVVDPPRPFFHSWIEWASPYPPYQTGQEFRINLNLAVQDISNARMDDPSMAALLPLGFEFVKMGEFYAWNRGTVPNPVVEVVPNFKSTGRTLVRLSWSAATGNSYGIPATGIWEGLEMFIHCRVSQRTPNGYYPLETYALSRNVPGTFFNWSAPDFVDIDKDSDFSEPVGYDRESIRVLTANGAATLDSRMFVQGELDTTPKVSPATALTVPGGKADYTLVVKNSSGVVMKNLSLIDILPHVGDLGVVDLSPRGSKWAPFLVGAISAPGGTAYYSKSKNPCRDELTPGIPVGCEPPAWTTALPVDITTVRSVKLDFGATELYPSDELKISWAMRAPINAPSGPTMQAWNSFGLIATRGDDNTRLMPTEPKMTGVTIEPPKPPFLGDTVWLDANRNGLQEEGEVGVNGIRVDLYRDNGDNVANPATDTFLGYTVTTNDGSSNGKYLFSQTGTGKFFVVVRIPAEYGASPNDKGNDLLDSDGVYSQMGDERVAIMPVTELTDLETDLSWDQGLYDRSGRPAVWAMAPMTDGKLVIGGRFVASHGLMRKNIARLLPDGKPDTAFDPGAGFDGDVLSLALKGDGSLIAGGKFTSFDGASTPGIVHLTTAGRRRADVARFYQPLTLPMSVGWAF